MDEDTVSSTDLPLLANVDEVSVEHYILIFKCDFNQKCFSSCLVYVYITPTASTTVNNLPFRLILDCKNLDIHQVDEIEIVEWPSREDSSALHQLHECQSNPLQFEVEPWCIRIRRDGATEKSEVNQWPSVEPPNAMATWQAFITIPVEAILITSGHMQPIKINENDVETTFYSHALMKLPMATFALAIGFWKFTSIPAIDSCLYYPDGLLSDSVALSVSQLLIQVKLAAEQLLGTYPFPRLDLLILPRNYDSLGLANPNVIFLSQSVLSDDESENSMLGVRLAHEIAHGWFGLLIGASDWSEEWLSEGFATFLEDIIYSRIKDWSKGYLRDWKEIRSYVRHQTLMAELQEQHSDCLLTLRPNKGEIITDKVTNGLNPDKGFMQVHYLKGFFVLRYMSSLVGEDEFLKVIRNYIENYSGQLVTSKAIFKIFLSTFPELRSAQGLTVDSLVEQLLDNSNMPMAMKDIRPSLNNSLYVDVTNQAKWWRHFNTVKHRKKCKTDLCSSSTHKYFCSEQKILLLEMLLQDKHLKKSTLSLMNNVHKLNKSNAEVRHRWCELVIKHNYTLRLDDVKTFLYEDQGMGVYLYGELMVSEKYHLQNFANECWRRVEKEASYSTTKVIKEMLSI